MNTKATTNAVRAITAWQFRRIFRLVASGVVLALILVWALLSYAAIQRTDGGDWHVTDIDNTPKESLT